MEVDSSRAWVKLAGLASAAVFLAALWLLLWGPGAVEPAMVTPAPEIAAAAPPVENEPPPPPPPSAPPRRAPSAEPEPAPSRPGSIAGIVMTLDGLPVAEAAVSLSVRSRYETAAPDLPTAVTDAEGRFHVEGLSNDIYVVSARNSSNAAMTQVALYHYAPHRDVILILQPGAPIGGTVVSAGQPVAGARLAALMHDGQSADFTELAALIRESDEVGRFLFESMTPTAWGLYVTAPGFAPVMTEPIEAGTEDAVIELAPGAVLEGIVIDSTDGAPLAGVTITAQRVNYGDFGVAPGQAPTAADGTFRFDGLAGADYLLNLDDPLLTLRDGPMAIEVRAENNPALELWASAGGVVRGRVIDQSTQVGVAGVRITAVADARGGIWRRSAPTDELGGFTIRGLSVGAYRIQNERAQGYKRASGGVSSQTVQVRPGETVEGVELVLDGGIRVSGVVVFSDGSPAAGALVRGMGVEGGALQGWHDFTEAGRDGSFVLAGVMTPGAINLNAAVGDYENEVMGPYTVPAEGLHDLRLTLDLEKNCLAAGIVVDERGAPISASITARPDGRSLPSMAPRFETGPDGQFLLTNMTPGTWKLFAGSISHSFDRTEAASITLAPGEERRGLRLVYTLGDRRPISGTVTNRESKPVRASVEIYSIRPDGRNVNRTPMGSPDS